MLDKLPEILLDDQSYPTYEWLQFIKKYQPDESMPILKFIEILTEGWYYDNWGVILRKKRGGIRKLELHTGGWSGNEEIIHVILNNEYLTWYKMRYVTWMAGGHYYFEINED